MNNKRNKILQILIIFSILGALTSCTLFRIVIYNYDDINDYKKFPLRELTNDSIKFLYHTTGNTKVQFDLETKEEGKINFDDFLEANETVAFLIIQNDTIIYENYFKGYNKVSVVPSFSMAKSFLSILIGCAIDEGLIKSVNEPVTNYLPELKDNGFDKVTIEHLLQMTSGIKFNEGNFYTLGNLYYGRNLWKIISKLELAQEPGTDFKYLSVNAQLLGFVLERALKGKSVTLYFQEKLWRPLGMEYDASWSIDRKKNGMEKTFCCINACARDFAKIGRLYLDKGNWNGKQIVSEDWVRNSVKIDSTNGSVSYNQYMWWLPTPDGDFMAIGKRGQYIYVNPLKNLIIIRLGRKSGDVDWDGLFVHIATNY
jgi:CubicO group peptidase (beta-lactamase class C family)